MLEKFSLEAQRIISSAESLSFDLSHNSIGCEHFLLSILKIPDNILTISLKKYHVTFKTVISDLKAFDINRKQDIFFMEYDDNLKKLLENSILESKEYKEDKVSVNTMIIAFIKNLDGLCRKIFENNNVDIPQILALLIKNQRRHSDLDKIIDLHDLSSIKKDPLVGRKKELQQLILALKRRNKPNAILIGAPGVGKTAIVEELAHLLSENKVQGLENKRIYELDISSVVGGTKYRGEFEEKLKRIIKNVNEDGEAILFIDEIHNIIKAGGAEGAIDASNILKPYLSRGDIQIIGATTIDEYHAIFEKDKALNRRFQNIFVDPSSKEETLSILNTLKPIYEDYYKIKINDSLPNYIVEIAEEFIPNLSFPDKAIDILDNSCVLSTKELTKETINSMVEKFYNVTINRNSQTLKIKEELKKHILGQEEAIERISKNILKIEYGLNEENAPLATMLFVGPSGVGKTETAKIIAKNFYNSHDSLIKLDMACYQDSSSINKLIGSAPGYSGSDVSTGFVKKLRTHPNSVVLLDEIDKACIDVMDFFLNIIDDGYFIDAHNDIIDCKNVIFIMTSNAGYTTDLFEKKKYTIAGDQGIKNDTYKRLEHFFRVEFLNRLDDIIVFEHIDIETGKNICHKMLNAGKFFNKTTSNISNKLSLDEQELYRSGARYLKKTVLDLIMDDMTEENHA